VRWAALTVEKFTPNGGRHVPHLFIERCQKVAVLYRARYLDETRTSCPGYETDPWQSLRFFLMAYGFARQGSSPDFPRAAVDAVAEACEQGVQGRIADAVWRLFSDKLDGAGLNPANNPLSPKGLSYTRRYRGEWRIATVSGLSVTEFVFERLRGGSLVAWARDEMADGRLLEAHEALTVINGVSGKIASFFLRDVADIYMITPGERRELLQPIDVWIRFVARALAGNRGLSDRGCAEFIVEQSSAPERANQGIWYFCAAVASSSKYWVRRSIESPEFMNELVASHLNYLRAGADAASEFRSRWEAEQ